MRRSPVAETPDPLAHLVADDPGAYTARERLRRLLVGDPDAAGPVVVELARRCGARPAEITDWRAQGRAAVESAADRHRERVGVFLRDNYARSDDEKRRMLDARYASEMRADDELVEALETLLRLDPDTRPERVATARADLAERVALIQAERDAGRLALNVEHPGTRCPAVARKEWEQAGRVIAKGERIDLAEFWWPMGRLRRVLMLDQVDRSGRWADPDPEHLPEIERACALNEGARLAPEPVTPRHVTESDDDAIERRRKADRDRQARYRARKKANAA